MPLQAFFKEAASSWASAVPCSPLASSCLLNLSKPYFSPTLSPALLRALLVRSCSFCQTQSHWPLNSVLAQPPGPACLIPTLLPSSCPLNFSCSWIWDFQFLTSDCLNCSPYLPPSQLVGTLDSTPQSCNLLMLNLFWLLPKNPVPWRNCRTKSLVF